MKVRRLGQIFNPTHYDLPFECKEYAQSPQVLEHDDFVRIYFSTRAVDDTEKFLSHVAYVDFERDFSLVKAVSSHEVVALGKLGCFDEHGIFPFSVTRDGEDILAYTTGWSRRKAVSVETGIGLCVSKDNGETFTRLGEGPILSASLTEPFLVGDAFVRRFKDKLNMWYIYGTEWKRFAEHSAPDRIYKIGSAHSDNAITWEKRHGKQLIPDRLGPHESQALPSVTHYRNLYYMVFCYRESYDFRATKGRGYRLGFARSTDLIEWERLDGQVTFEVPDLEWDTDMQAYPHIFNLDDRLLLLYNGNEFGRFGFGLAEIEL